MYTERKGATLLNRLKNKASSYADKIGSLLNRPKVHRFNGFAILLPANHILPVYRQRHPKYDRFLPHLVKYLRPYDMVIDVGANVGDTLAAMVENNPSLDYVCIEADEEFFGFLTKNIQAIKKVHEQLAVTTIRSLVGKDISGVSLEGKEGTKHAVVGSPEGMTSQQIDALMDKLPQSNLRLLKSDVDGFDYDVIQSSISTIALRKPILFFECQFDFEYQKKGYEELLVQLEVLGYRDWVVFDNFGEVVLRANDLLPIRQLFDYVWRQNQRKATRTIYYFDILAIQSEDSELISLVMREYQ